MQDSIDMYFENMTVEDYGLWLVNYMSTLPEGPDFEYMQEIFNQFHEQIDLLEYCFLIPSYEPRRKF